MGSGEVDRSLSAPARGRRLNELLFCLLSTFPGKSKLTLHQALMFPQPWSGLTRIGCGFLLKRASGPTDVPRGPPTVIFA